MYWCTYWEILLFQFTNGLTSEEWFLPSFITNTKVGTHYQELSLFRCRMTCRWFPEASKISKRFDMITSRWHPHLCTVGSTTCLAWNLFSFQSLKSAHLNPHPFLPNSSSGLHCTIQRSVEQLCFEVTVNTKKKKKNVYKQTNAVPTLS